MTEIVKSSGIIEIAPQCHYFVVRKKRLCRMTVRPGRQYCGEHEPKPKTEEGQDDTRIPCPYDPKHTCYASKLEKHLTICNAKQTEQPSYIIHNINAPIDIVSCIRRPLSAIPKETLAQVINKVNRLYEKHIEGNIVQVAECPIHPAVITEFCEGDRTESSRRHMRQASSILHLVEGAGLVQDNTCYVELGAGKGQLSYYMGVSWCDSLTNSNVVVVDRAALRHKRDNKLRALVARLRADLAHLALGRVGLVQRSAAVVGCAKHLCGVATDYALRCITAKEVLGRVSGIVLATCCHHRCELVGYVASKQLQELGITGDEFNTMLGIVSWATCGDGRSRERRRELAKQTDQRKPELGVNTNQTVLEKNSTTGTNEETVTLKGENNMQESDRLELEKDSIVEQSEENMMLKGDGNMQESGISKENTTNNRQERDSNSKCFTDPKWREEVGRRAKALVDWGRVLYLRDSGFDTQLCYYVPASVSPENVCILATKPVN